jgi:hypothetical protein
MAKYLHWKMWHLEPDEEGAPPEWERLSEPEQSFYLTSVKALLDRKVLIRAALGL